MTDTYVIKDQDAPYFLTFRVIAWVDVFTRRHYRDIIVDAFNHCIVHKQLQVHAWVIMSNHVHCVLSSGSGRLSDTIRDFKRHTANQLLQLIQDNKESRRDWMLFQFKRAAQQQNRNEVYQIWTHENHAVEIDPFIEGMADSKINYIHDNPVRAGWVNDPEDYLYSSAVDYCGGREISYVVNSV